MHKTDAARIRRLNERPGQKGAYVLYWMQQSQRAKHNLALEFAISRANDLDVPVVVVFGLTVNYPEANYRHYLFMLEGLAETQRQLRDRGIPLVVLENSPPLASLDLGKKAALIVTDKGYMRHQKAWRAQVAAQASCQVAQVETDVIVPVNIASQKAEWAARTIRPKINRELDNFLLLPEKYALKNKLRDFDIQGLDLSDPAALLKSLGMQANPSGVSAFFKGGASAAQERMDKFIQKSLDNYSRHHNRPDLADVSGMGPYLHFGQVSAAALALQVKNLKDADPEAQAAYLEQIIVRRELAMNFVHFTPNYDQYACLPTWAQKTLKERAQDPRDHLYTPDQLEACDTHDPYWNAAMREMVVTGYMHNHMRMYWGKKILEWSPTPQKAWDVLLHLNNKYFLDGRDPNSYAGAGWIFGLHDRGWNRRPIFGTVRYMAASGLERKCKIKDYVARIDSLKP
ncbi:deoxyribodipyrimidine photo-lyase [Desulfatibacillum aliphaticivorans]|uniref:deoxyribodipyrimidine photo-lyase n=1 Tax=Desulfatibacillum aliphaticivorans TaxID=218208 RepID=UPI000405EC1D|nr:deoxyribodipyrimidine photo-lyase [Desulfatibacillum aliphaticivorans]